MADGAEARLELRIQGRDGEETAQVAVSRLVIAGWTGRDRAAMEAHIVELEALGVKRPAATPVFYRVAARRLTQAVAIEASGGASSGEAEYVLLRHAGRLLVGLGSDHTDRDAETYGITASKQMCDKPVGRLFWPYDEVRPHWDRLRIRSWIPEGGADVAYQEGGVDAMLHPDELLERLAAAEAPLGEGEAMFCGTLSARGGVRPAAAFGMELVDPVLGRRLHHRYEVRELPIRD